MKKVFKILLILIMFVGIGFSISNFFVKPLEAGVKWKKLDSDQPPYPCSGSGGTSVIVTPEK